MKLYDILFEGPKPPDLKARLATNKPNLAPSPSNKISRSSPEVINSSQKEIKELINNIEHLVKQAAPTKQDAEDASNAASNIKTLANFIGGKIPERQGDFGKMETPRPPSPLRRRPPLDSTTPSAPDMSPEEKKKYYQEKDREDYIKFLKGRGLSDEDITRIFTPPSQPQRSARPPASSPQTSSAPTAATTIPARPAAGNVAATTPPAPSQNQGMLQRVTDFFRRK
jgi:hypothetical protein